MGILGSIDTVYRIVACHNALGLSLFHRNLKGGEINLPQGSLIHNGVHIHPPQFLRVGGKMLGAGGNSLRLNAPDIPCRQLAGKVGVF